MGKEGTVIVGKQWEWKVRSYEGDLFMLETVHVGEHSKNMEVEAAHACGRDVYVTDLRTGDTVFIPVGNNE